MEKQLPKNWIEVQLIDILEVLENGSRPKGGVQGILEGVPSLGGEHLDSNGGFKFGKLKFVPTSFAKKMNRGRIKENDILIVKDGATTGKTSFVDVKFPFDLAFVNEHVFICRPFPNLNSKTIFYFLYGKTGFDRIMENFTGSAQGGINQKFASNTLIPLPPLAEQNRIVAKLDALFAQLETIKTSMAKVPLLLKDFRQQVLTQAVTGKLTEEWRKGKELEELTLIELSHFCKDSFYGPRFSKDDYTSEGFPTVRTTDMSDDGKIILTDDIPRVKITDSKKIELYKVNKGDLLITRTGSIGKMARYFEDEIVIPSAYLIRFRFNELALTDYVYYCLTSPYGQNQMGLNAVAVTQPNLNAQKIKSIKIPNIDIKEQQEIVLRVESLFAKADAIEKQYETLKAKIDTLPQAILHKAFKGELTQQLDSDGDARELLREIQSLRAEQSNLKAKKKEVKV